MSWASTGNDDSGSALARTLQARSFQARSFQAFVDASLDRQGRSSPRRIAVARSCGWLPSATMSLLVQVSSGPRSEVGRVGDVAWPADLYSARERCRIQARTVADLMQHPASTPVMQPRRWWAAASGRRPCPPRRVVRVQNRRPAAALAKVRGRSLPAARYMAGRMAPLRGPRMGKRGTTQEEAETGAGHCR